MTYQLSFYLQIAASISSILILFKGNKKILSLIPFTFLTSSYIFKPHFLKDNLNLANFYESGTVSDDLKYIFINNLFKFFGTNWLIFFILQLLASIIVFNLFYIYLPKEFFKDKINGLKNSIQIPQFIFITFNYIIIGLSNLSVNHPRQFLSTILLINCFFQISISEKQSKNIKLTTLLISILATLVHVSGVLSTIYIIYLYIKNNQFLSLSRIKTISFKDTFFQRYLNIFITIFIIISLFFVIKILYRFGISYASNFIGIGAYIKELDYYDRSLLGFLLPIINILPLIIYTSILPFSNYLKNISNKNSLKRYYQILNLYSFSAIAVIFLEYSVNFYSIGRLKTLLLPILFFLLFQIPDAKKSSFSKRSTIVIVSFLSLLSVYRSYSNVI